MAVPTPNLVRNLDPEAVKGAGQLIYSWARRAKANKPANKRQLHTLVDYMSKCDEGMYKALGGKLMENWAKSAIDGLGADTGTVVGANDILVLGLPYGGPQDGKDNDGHFFSPMTDFMDELIEFPPVMYTHGTQNGFEPETVGKVKKRWYDKRGGWFKVELDPDNPRYDQLMESNATGNLRASTGAVPASVDFEPNGHVNSWLVGELSLVDLRDGYQPVNGYAVTKAEVIFDDYYGDPVIEREPTLIEELKAQLNALLNLIANKQAEDGDCVNDDVFEAMTADETFYWKAERFGGKKRSELPDSSFVFPDERAFPIVTAPDVMDAVNSWGRYRGKHSFEEFKAGVKRRAKAIGATDELPEKWKEEAKNSKAEDMETEKCESCDEAKRLADELKAELNAQPAKCSKCPQAINQIRTWVKAGKIKPAEAFTLIDRFSEDDAGYDELVAEIEGRTIIPAKAELFIAGGQGQVDPNDMRAPVDQDHMNKQRRLLGLPVK